MCVNFAMWSLFFGILDQKTRSSRRRGANRKMDSAVFGDAEKAKLKLDVALGRRAKSYWRMFTKFIKGKCSREAFDRFAQSVLGTFNGEGATRAQWLKRNKPARFLACPPKPRTRTHLPQDSLTHTYSHLLTLTHTHMNSLTHSVSSCRNPQTQLICTTSLC